MPTTLQTATLLSFNALKNNYASLRLKNKELALAAQPGHKINLHVQNTSLPAAIMACSATDESIDLLCQHPVLSTLATTKHIQWDNLSGKPQLCNVQRKVIVIAENIHIASALFYCRQWLQNKKESQHTPLVLIGFHQHSPFPLKPSQLLVPDIPEGVIASLPLLDDWGIPSRIASRASQTGCFDGSVEELLEDYLKKMNQTDINIVRFPN